MNKQTLLYVTIGVILVVLIILGIIIWFVVFKHKTDGPSPSPPPPHPPPPPPTPPPSPTPLSEFISDLGSDGTSNIVLLSYGSSSTDYLFFDNTGTLNLTQTDDENNVNQQFVLQTSDSVATLIFPGQQMFINIAMGSNNNRYGLVQLTNGNQGLTMNNQCSTGIFVDSDEFILPVFFTPQIVLTTVQQINDPVLNGGFSPTTMVFNNFTGDCSSVTDIYVTDTMIPFN